MSDRHSRLIYASVILLGVAMSVAFSVIGSYFRSLGLKEEPIGFLAAILATGGLLASLPLGSVIRKLGAKVTLIVALAGFAGATALLPQLRSYPAMAATRFVEGACTVAIWVSYETLLLALKSPGQRAGASSLYAVALMIGYAVGPLLTPAVLAFGRVSLAFSVSGVLSLCNALLVWVFVKTDAVAGHVASGGMEPTSRVTAHPSRAMPLTSVAWRVKTSCFAMFASGYLKASLVLFLPLYLLESRSLAPSQPPVILACYAAGWLPFAAVGVRLSNRYGHLLLMRLLGAAGGFALTGFLFAGSFLEMCTFAALAGASLNAVVPIGMALQGNIVGSAGYSRASVISNGFYAAGTLIGPLLTGAVYARSGGGAILHIAALWLAFAFLCTLAANDDPARYRFRASMATPR
jgi:MFS family permease